MHIHGALIVSQWSSSATSNQQAHQKSVGCLQLPSTVRAGARHRKRNILTYRKTFSNIFTRRADQIDHDRSDRSWSTVDNLLKNPDLPCCDIVQDLYTSTYPTQETRPVIDHATRATVHHTDQDCICSDWQISIIKIGNRGSVRWSVVHSRWDGADLRIHTFLE